PEGYVEQIGGTEFVTSNPDIRNAITTNTTRNARFFGWAYADGIILADNILMMTGTQNAFAGVFTTQGLIAHEVGHIIDFDNQGLSNILGTDTSGLENEARTSGSADEVQADIIANGLLGTITDPDQQANFD